MIQQYTGEQPPSVDKSLIEWYNNIQENNPIGWEIINRMIQQYTGEQPTSVEKSLIEWYNNVLENNPHLLRNNH
jgi:hypothetical protein